jgi:hypothetical protein
MADLVDDLKIVKVVGGLEFGTWLECHHPNLTFTPSFFRGVGQPPTRAC